MTSVVRHEPTAISASGGRDVERHDDIPALRKHVVSLDAVSEREAKRTRSLRPSEEWAHSRASLGLALASDPQWGDPPPPPPAIPVGVPRASGDSWDDREPDGSTSPQSRSGGVAHEQ